jgi:NFU1 iron-sulfur cluster scaffold homolog, mitochondrial
MASADPSPTPNPNAMRFALDVTLPGTVSFSSAEEAAADPFAAAVFATGQVASVFGTNNFVTVTRSAGGDWGVIVPAVQEAAAEHL